MDRERAGGLPSRNGQRGHRPPAEWVDECRRRGWQPDVATIDTSLRRLHEAICERGGQRRARPYIASQLRRLAKSELR